MINFTASSIRPTITAIIVTETAKDPGHRKQVVFQHSSLSKFNNIVKRYFFHTAHATNPNHLLTEDQTPEKGQTPYQR